MTDKFKGVWKYSEIFERNLLAAKEQFKDLTVEQLIVKLAELKTAVYGIHYTLDALDTRGESNGYKHGTVYATSELFPDDLSDDNDDGSDKVFVTKWHPKKEGEQRRCYFEAQDPTWDGTQDFNERESLSIPCTTYVNDKVRILSAHESAMAAYVGGGAISFGDVRILNAVLRSTSPEPIILDLLHTEVEDVSSAD